ncbi:MAG: hypothetical protein Q8O37_16370 [Sulfuricellaceae bacterium]|nr:hypothetical protein [Sulfuricellaceae bacterium]
MPRKPITELSGGKSPRQRIWEAIRALSTPSPARGEGAIVEGACSDLGTFTADGLSRACKVEILPVREYIKCLVAGGWLLTLSQGGRGVNSVYRLEKDNGIEAPRVRRDGIEVTQGSGNEAMWGAISVLDNFSAQTIADISGANPSTAKTYCLMLAKAGYLVAAEPGKGTGRGGKPTIWSTVRSRISGPRAPMITRLKAIYDPNLHQVMWMAGADEAAEEMDHV